MASAVASSSAGPETRSERRVSGSGKGGGSPVSTSDVALTIPAFACMVEARVSFVFANRTTHSDVMSVKTTSAPVLVPPPVRRAGAQANQVRRLVLPTPKTLPVHPAFSTAKKSKALIRERDAFMARLRQEREERHLRENLAAVRIQAVWRGQQVRPKPKRVTRQRKQRPTLKDWREELRALTNATEEHLGGGDGEPKPEWRRNIQRKATAKRTRKLQRAVQYTAAASMQALARGFLARRAFRVVLGLHRQEVEHDAVTYIQAMFRGFALRRSMAEAGRLKREDAAISIQRVVRGTQARTRCRWLMRRMRAAQEETAAATSIQCAFRASAARRAVDGKRQHKAAVRVQSSMRGHRARRDVTARTTQRREAAVHIQRTGRGYLARQEYGPRVEEAKERAKQERAATRIQSIARGRQARRRVAAKRVEVAEERAARAAQEEKAALHMQRVGRGKLARKRVQGIRDERKQHAAATKIQAVKRGKSARLHVRKKRRSKQEKQAAVKVQSAARGRLARRRVSTIKRKQREEREAKAATKIASAARGKHARKRVEGIRQARREALEAQATDAPRRRKRGKKRGSGGSSMSASDAEGGGDGAGAASASQQPRGSTAAPATADGRPPRP